MRIGPASDSPRPKFRQAAFDNKLTTTPAARRNRKLRRLRDSNHLMHPHSEFEIRVMPPLAAPKALLLSRGGGQYRNYSVIIYSSGNWCGRGEVNALCTPFCTPAPPSTAVLGAERGLAFLRYDWPRVHEACTACLIADGRNICRPIWRRPLCPAPTKLLSRKSPGPRCAGGRALDRSRMQLIFAGTINSANSLSRFVN